MITRDEAFAFQTQLEVASEAPVVPRPNLRSLGSSDWDERVGDLQYRDVCEFAVGHSVATDAVVEDCHCRLVRTCWIPDAEVERVAQWIIRQTEKTKGQGQEYGLMPPGVVADWGLFSNRYYMDANYCAGLSEAAAALRAKRT